MAATYKVLGQSAPSATTATALYTVPASTSTIVSTLTNLAIGIYIISFEATLNTFTSAITSIIQTQYTTTNCKSTTFF